jgi:hypothetical protein
MCLHKNRSFYLRKAICIANDRNNATRQPEEKKTFVAAGLAKELEPTHKPI